MLKKKKWFGEAEPKIHIEMQSIWNSKNSKGKEQSLKTHSSQFEILLYRCSNKNQIVLS